MLRTCRIALVILLAPIGCEPSLAQQFNGARYVWRTNLSGGGYSVTHYEIKGNSVIRTVQTRAYDGHVNTSTSTYPLSGNHFTYSLPSEWCLEAFSTTNCGIRGALSESEIRFTTVINGRDTGRYQTVRFMWDLEPAKRQY